MDTIYFKDWPQKEIYFYAHGYDIIIDSRGMGFPIGLASISLIHKFGRKTDSAQAKKITNWFKRHPDLSDNQKTLLLMGCHMILHEDLNRLDKMTTLLEGTNVKLFSADYYEGPEFWLLKDLLKFRDSAKSHYQQLRKHQKQPDLFKYLQKIDEIIDQFKKDFGYYDKEVLYQNRKKIFGGQLGKSKYSNASKLFLVILRNELASLQSCQIHLEKQHLSQNKKEASIQLSGLLSHFGLEITPDVIRRLYGKVEFRYSTSPLA